MNLLSIKDIAKIGRETALFTDVTFGLNSGDKAALIGKNGTGKSTLLSIIAGVIPPDAGEVVVSKSAGVSYLAQSPSYNENDTIREHIFRASSPKLSVIREYQEICALMENGTRSSLQERYQASMHKMDSQGLWNYEAQVQSVLGVLGIHSMERRMGELSGGMIKKVALAQVLVEDTGLLLLDEPTNHLDITTIKWLQDYLSQTERSVLMVTHDRYFLDAVCNHIYELDRHRVKLYVGNYSEYLEKKQVEAQIEANTERRIESVLRFERDWLMRGPCARGTKAKARIQHDMALINREKFQADKGFTFEVQGRRLGGKILELHGISKNYPKGFAGEKAPRVSEDGGLSDSGEKLMPVIKNFSYTFNKGQRIGIFGENGSGKTTLLNIISGSIPPDSGTIIKGENTMLAYYQQNPVLKDSGITVLEYVKESAEIMRMNDGTTLSAAQFLEQFGFTGKMQHSAVSSLSGGERKRLFLVRLLLSNPNFLILDEPTNDFDIFTMNILEQFLTGFKGCLLVVSHDRYFMDKVCDTLFIMEDDGSVSGYVGKCSEYIQYREILEKERQSERKSSRENQRSSSSAASNLASVTSGPLPDAMTQKKKLTFKEQREFEQLERTIAELEERLKILETQMLDADFTKASDASSEYARIQSELEASYARWEYLAALA